jgi:HK97 family phage portal protein
LILATRSGDLRVANLDALVAMELQAGGGRTTLAAGMAGPVTGRSVAGLPAANMAIRIAAGAVAKRQLAVWRGTGTDQVLASSSWQARLFAGQPNGRESWFDVLEQLEASLTARNNGYWLKSFDSGRVAEVRTIHPDTVQARWNGDRGEPEYRIHRPSGQWTEWIGPESLLHFRVGYPEPGCIVAPSPLELSRMTWEAAIAKTRHEAIFYRKGLTKGVAVTFPKEMKPEQARNYRDALAQESGGVENGGDVRVFGGGATVQTIGLTLADAEFVASKMLSAGRSAQLLGVPATLLDIGDAAQKPLSPEHEEDRWNRHLLEPRLARIEGRSTPTRRSSARARSRTSRSATSA